MLLLLYYKIGETINSYIPIIVCIIYVIFSILYFNKYIKFTILNYIDEFSADLFNWYKIYELHIDEEIKQACFAIHYIDYDAFKEQYYEYLTIQKQLIDLKIKCIAEKNLTIK